MTSIYLQSNEAATYGVTATPGQIASASALVNAYLKRPEGLVWMPDASGNPCYMAGASADLVYNSASAINPGTDVVVNVTGGPILADYIGRPLVLDAGNASACEACMITAVNPAAGTITLASVAHAHVTTPVSLRGGLQIFEERYLPQDRSLARVSRWPIARVVSGLGRYAYGRRSQQVQGNFSEFNLLSILQNFGGPPTWIPFDVTQLGINHLTGELWIPAGLLLAYYSDARLYYVAGWSQANLPSDIKQATANIVLATQEAPTSSTNIRRAAAGDTSVERFADTVIDAGTRALLDPYKAHLFV